MEDDGFYKSVPQDAIIKVCRMCAETIPCYHNVYKNGKFYKDLNAIEIVKLLKEYNIQVPSHFGAYE